MDSTPNCMNVKRSNIYGAFNNSYQQQQHTFGSGGGSVYTLCGAPTKPNITCNYIFNPKTNLLTRDFSTSFTATPIPSERSSLAAVTMAATKNIRSLEILENPKLVEIQAPSGNVTDSNNVNTSSRLSNLIYSVSNYITSIFKPLSQTTPSQPEKEMSRANNCDLLSPVPIAIDAKSVVINNNSSNPTINSQSSSPIPNTKANVVVAPDLNNLENESNSFETIEPINNLATTEIKIEKATTITANETMLAEREENKEINNCDTDNNSRRRKRKKRNVKKQQQVEKMTTVKQQCSSFNPNNFYRKSKCVNKNRKNKNRTKVQWNMEDDITNITAATLSSIINCDDDDNDEETEENFNYESCYQKPIPQKISCNNADALINKFKNILNIAAHSSKNSNNTNSITNDICYFYQQEHFPTISTTSKVIIENTPRKRESSECDSEDSFIIFSNDTPQSTPPTIPIISTTFKATATSACASNSNFCDKLKNTFLSKQPTSKTVTLSGNYVSKLCSVDSEESSEDEDDSCSEDDDNGNAFGTDDEDDDDDNDDFVIFTNSTDACDKKFKYDSDTEITTDSETEDVESQQPDSGFEEKKVRFNMKPDIILMKKWDFAYRQARKGEWEQIGRDRVRFNQRIMNTKNIIDPILDKNFRDNIYRTRFQNDQSTGDGHTATVGATIV